MQEFAQNIPTQQIGFASEVQANQLINPTVQMNQSPAPRGGNPANTSSTNHGRISGGLETYVSGLPPKVLENCQRTGRVIIISELERKLSKDKKQKMELQRVLSEFVPKFQDPETGEYSENKKYYQSLNYSRVRIGHKQFIKKILSNTSFQKPLTEIFDSENLYNSEKARKNERSPISFEERKRILQVVLLDYKGKFFASAEKPECHLESTIIQSHAPLDEKEPEPQKAPEEQYVMRMNEQLVMVPVQITPVMFPLVPIPLSPAEYEAYMQSRDLAL